MRTSDSDLGAVTGLEIWRQMSIHFAGSAKTRTVSLLKQIMSPVEWNAEKSKDVIQQYYRWLELISKYEAISSEKITDTVKITLALQNVKGNLVQALNVSINDSTTWPQAHALLINYFNNAVPVDLKPIYQFDQTEKTEINSLKKGKGKGQKSNGQKGKGSKGSSSFQNSKGKQKGKGKTKSKGKGQWTAWSWNQIQQNANWGQQGQKGSKSGKEKSACSIYGKSGRASNQCWWNRDQEGWSSQGSAQQLKGSSGSQYSKEVYNIHQYPQDQPIQTLPPDQLRGFRDLRPQGQQQQYQNLSQASTQCGSIATVLSSSDQGGFSGQRLNINYLSDSCDLGSEIKGQEICASFPFQEVQDYPVTFRSHGQRSSIQVQLRQLHRLHSRLMYLLRPTVVSWSMYMVER